MFTSWYQEYGCIFCTTALLFQTRKKRLVFPLRLWRTASKNKLEMYLVLEWSLKRRIFYLYFLRKLRHHILSLISEICDILLDSCNISKCLRAVWDSLKWVPFYTGSQDRPVNSWLPNMLIFISMPIYSSRWKSFLLLYSKIFTGNKHISFLSLICKTKKAVSFPCPLTEKFSFPLSIPHHENPA